MIYIFRLAFSLHCEFTGRLRRWRWQCRVPGRTFSCVASGRVARARALSVCKFVTTIVEVSSSYLALVYCRTRWVVVVVVSCRSLGVQVYACSAKNKRGHTHTCTYEEDTIATINDDKNHTRRTVNRTHTSRQCTHARNCLPHFTCSIHTDTRTLLQLIATDRCTHKHTPRQQKTRAPRKSANDIRFLGC